MMHVKELIEELSKYPQDAEILLATSPYIVFDILSVYADDVENRVWLDIEESS